MNQVLDHDSSIDTQLTLIRHRETFERQRAASQSDWRPWQIVSEYREEGRSGKNTDRPELQRLLADVRAGKLDVVAVTKIDRITRSLIDFYDLWETFQKHKVEFVSLNDQFETTTAAGRAMLKLTLVFAELERERTSERTREKVEVRREAGKWFGGAIPFGYKANPNNPTTLDVDEAAAEIVRRDFFEKFLELGSARALTRYLAQHSITRPKRVTRRGNEAGGTTITTQGVLNLLSNSLYIARRRLDDEREVECNWPPIIERQLFDQVQAKLNANKVDRPSGKPTTGHVYILEGLLRCGACGSMMVRASGTGRNGLYFYYRCGKKNHTASQACRVRDIPVGAVEKFVIDQLKDYAVNKTAIVEAVRIANEGRNTDLVKVEDELVRARAALAVKAQELGKLADAIEQGGTGMTTLVQRMRERQVQADALKTEVMDLETKRNVLRTQTLDAEVIAEGYSRLPFVLDEAVRVEAHAELQNLLQAIIQVVEWHERPGNPKEGWAEIELLKLPEDFWAGGEGEKAERLSDPSLNGSLSRPDWLPTGSG
jgi:site-specific DNA recombinase